MVAKLQHGGSFSTTETQTISITIIDEINQPNYLEVEIVSPGGNRETTYAPGALVRVIEDDAAGDPVIFQGRVDKISAPTHPVFGQIVRIQARDNLAELAYITMKDGTYSANGTDALINTIIRAHGKTIGATGIDLPAIDSNTADFTTSLRTSARTYTAKNDSKSVLEVITHLADSDPWHANYASTTNYGYAFWLDEDNDFHYHQLGTWPTTAPVAYGLGIVYGLAADTDIKRIMRNPGAWDDSADEAVGEVQVTYTGKIEDADTGVTKTLRLKRFTHGTVGGSGYPFHRNDEILGGTSGAVGKVQLVTSGAILVSHVSEGDNEVPTGTAGGATGKFTPGETIVVTKVDRNSDGVYSNGAGLGGNDDEIGAADSEQAPYKYSAPGTTASTHLTTAGASATFTTTPDLEDVQTRTAYIRPQEYQSFDTSDISARQGISEVADYYARRGFIDVSADAFVKGTVQISGYPTYMYTGSDHIPVRAGEHIYISNSVTTSVAGNYHVSRIVFKQNTSDGSYGSTIYVTNDNGVNWKKTLHEINKSLAKDASISAIDATGRGQVSLLDTATSSGYVPTESYGTFRYSLDGGGGSADTLGFLSGQTIDTPVAGTNRSSFWSMLSEADRLIFEPIVGYSGSDNNAWIGYHNQLVGVNSFYLYAGDGTVTNPGFRFVSDPDTGIYRAGTNTIGFSTGDDAAMTLTTDGSDKAELIFPGNLVASSSAATDVQLLDSNNQLIEVSSSRRFKENIVDLELDSTKIYDLRPVTFNPLNDPVKTFGLIAEEVVEYFPELVSLDNSGIPKSVSYSKLPVLLLAEIQKLRKELDEIKEKL